MGAQQSVPGSEHEDPTVATKTCYYELIGVETDATDIEIKKAYRKKALELHPDRNLNNVQTATRKFAEIQAAYEVLSDPQERAWYDSHRDAILAGKDDVGSSVEPATFRNVRLTPTEEIFTLIRKFNATIPFNDEPYGFFGVSRETFEHLALEEETAGEMGQLEWPDYPTFGSSDDDYETVVRPFYAAWSGFSTKKSFSWKDKYRLSDAPDRRVRRLMEKDNKKCRDDAIREFNDAVRFLVTFVRKRDPRYLPNSQTDAERQKNLRDAAAAQAARSRAANRQKFGSYELPDWSQPPDDHNQDSCFSESEEDSEIEILECVVCNKSFKSIQQLEAHERSKKHLKAVHQLRKQMKKEGVDLELDTAQGQNPDQHQNEVHLQASGSFENSSAEADCPLRAEHEQIKHRPVNGHGRGQSASSDSESDRHADEYAPSGEVDEQLDSAVSRSCGVDNIGENAEDHIIIASAQSMNLDESSTPTQNKIGKAKAKRQKKAARHAKDETQERCGVCHEGFSSRTKLFDHIRQENHVAAKPTVNSPLRPKKGQVQL